MNSWYDSGLHCWWSKCHEHEHQEIVGPLPLLRTFGNPFLHPFEKISGIYRDAKAQVIISEGER